MDHVALIDADWQLAAQLLGEACEIQGKQLSDNNDLLIAALAQRLDGVVDDIQMTISMHFSDPA